MPVAILVVADLTVVTAIWLIAYWVRFSTIFEAPLGVPPFGPYARLLLLILPLWFGVFRARGLYEVPRSDSLSAEAMQVLEATAIATVVLAAAMFFFRSFFYYSRGVTLVFFALCCVTLVAVRLGLPLLLERRRSPA